MRRPYFEVGGQLVVKIQIVILALLLSLMAAAEEECEFYGIAFGKPSGVSTNELTLFEGEGESWRTNAQGERTHEKHGTRSWTGVRGDLLLPAAFFDQVVVSYSYRTVTPVSAFYFGHFPKGTSRKDCLKLMDAFVQDVKQKYGIELSAGDDRREDEPEGFVFKDPPRNLKDPQYRYCPSGKFGPHFVRYACSREPMHVQMDASESAFGERVVALRVHLYRANGGEVADREGRMSADEYEAFKARTKARR